MAIEMEDLPRPRGAIATGKYELADGCAEFFGSHVLYIIARGPAVLGRFGRSGILRGSIDGALITASWEDGKRKGWMRLTLDQTGQSCACEYGTFEPASNAAGRSVLKKLGRRRREK